MTSVLCAVVVAAALLLLPGWLLARAWGVRGLRGLGLAAPVSVAWLSLASLGTAAAGLRWSWSALVGGGPLEVVGLLAGLGLVAGWYSQRRARWVVRDEGAPGAGRRRLPRAGGERGPGRRRGVGLGRWGGRGVARVAGPAQGRRWSRSDRAALAGAVLAGVMTGVPVWLGTGGASSPAQASDAVFHLSATAFVRATGNASFLGGLAPMYEGAARYYPTAWHALAALVPGDVAMVSNVLVLLMVALVWPLGVAALVGEVSRAVGAGEAGDGVRPLGVGPLGVGAVGVGAALAGSVISPVLLASSVWPYALSVCLTPGALAGIQAVVSEHRGCGCGRRLGVRDEQGERPGESEGRGESLSVSEVRDEVPGVREDRGRRLGERERRVPGGLCVVTALACLGVVLAHGTGLFNLAVLAGPLLAPGCVRAIRRQWRASWRRRAIVLVGCAALTLGAAGLAWFGRGALRAVMGYARAGANVWETLFALVTDHPLLAVYTPWIPGNVLLPALALAGAWAARRVRELRPWVVAFALGVLLVLLASGPAWPGRALAGPWYTQRARMMPLVSVAELALAVGGLAQVEAWARGRLTARRDGGPALKRLQEPRAVMLSATGDSLASGAREDPAESGHEAPQRGARPGGLRGATRIAGLLAGGARVPAAVLVVSLLLAPGWRWPLRSEIMASVHDPSRIAYGQMLGPGEEELVRSAGRYVPAGSVVVADPSNGSAYLWSLGGVTVLFPARPRPPSGSRNAWLGGHLDQLVWNWQICYGLRQAGVDYYYSDDDPRGRQGLWGPHWQVSPLVLEPVAHGGSATLWRIRWDATVCG